jgi:hypothetical protein
MVGNLSKGRKPRMKTLAFRDNRVRCSSKKEVIHNPQRCFVFEDGTGQEEEEEDDDDDDDDDDDVSFRV